MSDKTASKMKFETNTYRTLFDLVNDPKSFNIPWKEIRKIITKDFTYEEQADIKGRTNEQKVDHGLIQKRWKPAPKKQSKK